MFRQLCHDVTSHHAKISALPPMLFRAVKQKQKFYPLCCDVQ